MVDTGILSNNMKFLSNKLTFCSLTKYNDNPQAIRLYTNPWLFFLPNSTFYWLMRGFHRRFATGVACWQGKHTSPATWSRPIWDLHMFYLLRPIYFSNLSKNFSGLCYSNIPRYFLDFASLREKIGNKYVYGYRSIARQVRKYHVWVGEKSD